jgi:septal ring factor EnvC (AmiA/AmiB activator)
MALLRRDAIASLETELAKLKRRRDDLAGRRARAADGLTAAQHERGAAVDADEPQRLASAADRVLTTAGVLAALDEALVDLDGQIADAEAKIAAARDQAERAREAERVEKRIDASKTAGARFFDVAKSFATALAVGTPAGREAASALRHFCNDLGRAHEVALAEWEQGGP